MSLTCIAALCAAFLSLGAHADGTVDLHRFEGQFNVDSSADANCPMEASAQVVHGDAGGDGLRFEGLQQNPFNPGAIEVDFFALNQGPVQTGGIFGGTSNCTATASELACDFQGGAANHVVTTLALQQDGSLVFEQVDESGPVSTALTCHYLK